MSKQQKGKDASKQQDQRKQDDDMKSGKNTKSPAGQSWNDKKDAQGKVSTKSNQ